MVIEPPGCYIDKVIPKPSDTNQPLLFLVYYPCWILKHLIPTTSENLLLDVPIQILTKLYIFRGSIDVISFILRYSPILACILNSRANQAFPLGLALDQ